MFVLIILGVAPLLTFGFINLAGSSLLISSKRTDQTLARYAADAGVTDVVSDLIQGEDALSLSYSVPSPTVNGLPVTVAVDLPVTGTEPSPIYQYIDPGTGFGLQSLPSQSHYFLRIDNVQTGSTVRLNWAFTPIRQRWKLKLYAGVGPVGVASPLISAQDDFESGDFLGGSGWICPWVDQGDASVVSDGGPFEGNFHLRLRRGNGHVERTVDLTGFIDVRLQFQAKASSFEPGETATCSVSPDGVTFTVVRIWVDGEDDDIYRFEDIDLSAFPMTSSFVIACDSAMSNRGDQFFIDDIKVVSQVVPSPLAEASSTKGPGELFVSGDLITTADAYTFDFFNDSGTDLVSAGFVTTGDPNSTWISAIAHKDYVITSTAGTATIKAYVRQIPGPSDPAIRQQVFLESWKER